MERPQATAVTMTDKLKMVGILKKIVPSKRRQIAANEQEEVSVKIPVTGKRSFFSTWEYALESG